MHTYRIANAIAMSSVGFATPAWAQSANSSGGAGSATQSSSGGVTGNTGSGTANGQSAGQQSFPAGGTGGAASTSKIGPPTDVEQREQQKSDQSTQICKGC